MSLLDKATKFEQLSEKVLKKAQSVDTTKPFRFNSQPPPASLSGPTPRYSVPTRVEPTSPAQSKPISQPAPTPAQTQKQPTPAPQPKLNIPESFIKEFAGKLVNFNPEQWQGVSVDAEALKTAGAELQKAINAHLPWMMLKALDSVMKLTRNGGGPIFSVAQRIYTSIKQSLAVAKAPAKQPDFLDRYMKEEKMKEMADNQMKAMEAMKNMPSAVQEALNQSGIPSSKPGEYDPNLGF